MASIDPRMWDDDRFNELDILAKLLWAFLLSGPHTVTWVPGIVHAGTASLAEAMRCSEKSIKVALASLRAAGLVDVDEPCRLIRLPNAPAYNPPGNPNVMRGFHRRWRALPECGAKYSHLESVSVWENKFSDMYAETFGSESLPEAFRKPFESLSKETVTETETDNRDLILNPDARESSRPGNPGRVVAKTSDQIPLALATDLPTIAPGTGGPGSPTGMVQHARAAELAVWSEFNRFRTGAIPRAREIRPAPSMLKRVTDLLAEGYSLDDFRAVFAHYATPEQRAWFNAVTPFRPDNFARALSAPPPVTRPTQATGKVGFAAIVEQCRTSGAPCFCGQHTKGDQHGNTEGS